MKKKIVLGLIALMAVVGGVAGMSAFEAHVINVTAHIENALSVNTEPIDFGTVFPQEYLEETFVVELSSSFLAEDRADDVNYVIKQKPKPIWPIPETCDHYQGEFTIEDMRTYCHASPGDLTCCYLSLCPFLSKMDGDPEDNNDTSHRSYFQGTSCLTEADPDATGRLSKLENDLLDIWILDLKVPPVEGFVGQDWPAGCPTVAEDSKNYGCDLWIEVTDISETPERPTVGADLSSYVQTTNCDVYVPSQYSTIQAGIDAATTGETVCVSVGTYDEDVVINKSLTLAGDGAGATSTINGQTGGQGAAVRIAADNVILEGFQINGMGIAALWLNTGVSGATVRYNKIISASGGVTAVTTQGLQSNHVFSNNEFVGTTSAQIVYVNGEASLGGANVSDNVDFTYNTFSGTIGTGNIALGNEAANSEITGNVFEATLTSTYAIADLWEDTIVVNTNNFNGTGGIKVMNGDAGTLDAENNWWGDNDPSNNVSGLVDYDPWESSAYPEY